MKIGFLQPWDSCGPPDVGGSLGIWTWEVARRLARSHEVLVCSRRSPSAAAFEVTEGVQFCRLFLNLDMRLMRLTQRISRHRDTPDIASRLYCCIYLLRAGIVLRAHNCDVIHIFNLSQFAWITARLNPGAKIVLNMHCDFLLGMDYSLINKRLRHVDRIVGCANCITDEIRSRFPHYAERCETIYNGVDVDRFFLRERPDASYTQTLVTVGRISPEKGLHVLLEAFEKVLDKAPNTELRIIGPEMTLPAEAISKVRGNSRVREVLSLYSQNYLQRLQERVRGSLRGKVSFVGPLPHAQIAAEMRKATILVQPSLYDLFPLPVLEGMATGLPVVASKVGGLSEVVMDGKTGLLVEPGNSVQLAEALIRLLDNRSEAQSMGLTGRARALDMFSWEAVVCKLRSGYESCDKFESKWAQNVSGRSPSPRSFQITRRSHP